MEELKKTIIHMANSAAFHIKIKIKQIEMPIRKIKEMCSQAVALHAWHRLTHEKPMKHTDLTVTSCCCCDDDIIPNFPKETAAESVNI